tara:strand:+ start:844 stop:2244 length:1401 start_codon:yes stop_codon:yes gene_type:complete
MKKAPIFFAFILLIFPLTSAINLNIEEKSSNAVLIPEINRPAIFTLNIKNLGPTDNIEFYNLLGFSMAPKGTIDIDAGEIKEIELMVYPRENFDFRGFYTFEYFIRSQDDSELLEKLTMKIVDLEDVFEIGSEEINPESNSMQIYVHNKENISFKDINGKFDSSFFEFEKVFSLGPNQRKNFEVSLNKEDFKKLMAGFYTFTTKLNIESTSLSLEGTIKFIEKDILTNKEEYYGGVVNTEIIEKKNEGNVLAETNTIVRKNIISRLFTTFDPEPDSVSRENVNVYYTWNREIPPGEILTITVKTNWLFPIIIAFLVLIIVMLVKQYKRRNLVLRKRVNFVHAKGGEFALKVSLTIHAKDTLERVQIIDRLPNLVKIYERFGSEKPKRINERTRRIEWEFDALESGETRVVSYIIYSKIGVLGKFALPEATGIYEKDGKIHESQSNKTFFISEQKKGEVEKEDNFTK